MILSVIIPSYRDPLSQKTIRSLLDGSELGDKLEIIQVLDGYWPDFELVDDPRVRFVHLGQNRGMRGAINAGVQVSRGKFIMRTDEHCSFDQGFDRKITEVCRPNWIMHATRYFLDPKKWELMDIPPVQHEKLIIQGGKKFAGQRWPERDRWRRHKTITSTMAMQGSVWVMPRTWWDKVIGELQTEGYGPLTQDSHEMVFKTWKAGGELKIHKGTWYSHKHRSFSRTHNAGTTENPANTEQSYAYCIEVWGDYYQTVVRKRWGV